MQVSDLFIRRPVFSIVVSMLLVVAGLASLARLPVREYPAIDPPVVSVSTVYQGASSEVMENRVTEVIEGAVAGIEGIRQITSSSQDERSSVRIEFEVERDIEAAANDVRDRVSRVVRQLPDGVDTPVIFKVDANADAIMWVGFTSSNFDALELTDYLRRNIVDRISTVPGVANVNIGGERRYAMRIFLDRQALAARGLTAQDVETAIRRQNVELPGGRLTSSQREFTVKTQSRLSSPEEFSAIVLANRNGVFTRLQDVARVEVAAEDERFEFYNLGQVILGLGVTRQSTANTLSVAQGVRAELEQIRPSLPAGTQFQVLYDESTFINASIKAVLTTLAEGIGLVVLVILVFLRDWRSTFVAIIAIPVSIIGAFTVVSAFGASINVLTLLAIVLAVGIVVDDAIVEIENVHRRIEEGEPPLLASFLGARELGFAVIATTATLIAVFVPLAFMEGRTGRLFREFAITLAAAIFFSGVVARTLTPMLCSKLMSAHHGPLHRWTEPFFTGMEAAYRFLLRQALRVPLVMIALAMAVSLSAWQLFLMIPKEFAPTEDRGVIILPITAPEGSSLDYTRARAREIEAIIARADRENVVASVLTIVAPGFSRPAPVNSALAIIRLKPWDQRTVKQQDIQRALMGPVGSLPGARAFPVNPPAFGQRSSAQPIQFVLGGPDYQTLKDWRDRVVARAQTTGLLVNLDSDFRENQPDLRVSIDRARAADMGVPVETIGRTLELFFGEREISTFIDRGEEYPVIVQARDQDRASPSDLANIFVRAENGELVPLSSFVTLVEAAAPQQLNRVDRLRSITIQGAMAPGVTIGDGLALLERIVAEELPADARISYTGQSREFKDTSTGIYVTFAFALLIVFLVLAAQFESFINPLIIMLTVPLAMTGGLLALLGTGQTLNIYSQIGMILLIGLMTKNGILIVEFTNQLRERGFSVPDALMQASSQRLRPILMTSIATVLGAFPLAFSHGAGAESRMAIGWVIVGGVSLSTVLTLFVVPSLYLLIGGFTKPANHTALLLERLRGRLGHGETGPEADDPHLPRPPQPAGTVRPEPAE